MKPKNSNSVYLPVRMSHLLKHCSVGAIVSDPDGTLLVIKDTHTWKDTTPLHYVDGVRSALSITEELRTPPIATFVEDKTTLIDGTCIEAMRFPSWMNCEKCGALHHRPWSRVTTSTKNRDLRCQICSAPLAQIHLVLVHEHGWMSDVPWHYLTHRKHEGASQRQCGHDTQKPHLAIDESIPNRRKLRCLKCGSTAELHDKEEIPFGNARMQPWASSRAVSSQESNGKHALILETHDVLVHSAVNKSAIVIPPESRSRGGVVGRLYTHSKLREEIENAKKESIRRIEIRRATKILRCTESEIEDALEKILAGFPLYGRQFTKGALYEKEYEALTTKIDDFDDEEDFVTLQYKNNLTVFRESLDARSNAKIFTSLIYHLSAVTRLKEILVFKGFQRLKGKIVPPDLDHGSGWLPAIDLYGEGIFFTLNEEKTRAWERNKNVMARAGQGRERYKNSGLTFDPDVIVSPRFLLLHTLAHLLIRQLEAEAGYPAASLKERIYCSTSDDHPMAGILIYVAVPDVSGSLGGLAELANPERFLPLIVRVFEHAHWCSLDPVCREHEGQGPGFLNRAACHGCALIPEPSCAYGNILLDRIFVCGSGKDELPGFAAQTAPVS